jgi:hypothetical protein
MKPLRGDHRHRLLISGDELRELQRLTWAMAEAFGLDRKIENYKGTRPLTLYRWDLECLMDVIEVALRDCTNRAAPGYLSLKSLGERLRQDYDAVYGREKSPPLVTQEKGVSRQSGKKGSLSKTPARKQNTVYQLKITLLEITPPIWRRIQVKDCTLDKLHEHIQTAMGWTNSHLHHFKIGDRLYGDPMLMEENMEEMEYEDSTTTKLSDILPKSGKQCRFIYEYDFGDGWEHEVLFEGCPKTEPGRQYPVCLEGERACPPEDVGGTGGYEEFLETIANPDHEEHDEMLGWVGGRFDPEAFDPAVATKEMKKGLPDWRNEDWI